MNTAIRDPSKASSKSAYIGTRLLQGFLSPHLRRQGLTKMMMSKMSSSSYLGASSTMEAVKIPELVFNSVFQSSIKGS
jgi:hypothetical protein